MNYGCESAEIEDEREVQWVVEAFETIIIKGEKGEWRSINSSLPMSKFKTC